MAQQLPDKTPGFDRLAHIGPFGGAISIVLLKT
jgi:hypothetical protein